MLLALVVLCCLFRLFGGEFGLLSLYQPDNAPAPRPVSSPTVAPSPPISIDVFCEEAESRLTSLAPSARSADVTRSLFDEVLASDDFGYGPGEQDAADAFGRYYKLLAEDSSDPALLKRWGAAKAEFRSAAEEAQVDRCVTLADSLPPDPSR